MKPASFACALAALLLAPALAAAQSGIHGIVVEDSTDAPIANATVVVLSAEGDRVVSAQTGDDGTFSIQIAIPARYSLQAERIGYQTARSGAITVAPEDTVLVRLNLSTRTTVLAPLTVVAASAAVMRDVRLMGFEHRRARGFGRFLGPEQLRNTNGMPPTDILSQRIPFLRVNGTLDRVLTMRTRLVRFSAGPRCLPTVYIDSHMYRMDKGVTLDQVVPGELAAVEVYDSPNQAPGEFPPVNPYCGVIVLWTRR